jgi:hypothetical protein
MQWRNKQCFSALELNSVLNWGICGGLSKNLVIPGNEFSNKEVKIK